MRNTRLTFLVIFAGLALEPADSLARSTDACFTKDEVRIMAQKREVFAKASSACLQNYWDTHVEFFNANRYSKYFGNRNTEIDTVDKRMKALLHLYWPQLLPLKDLRKFETEFHLSEMVKVEKKEKKKPDSPGLSDLEKYLKANHSALYQVYLARKPEFRLEMRAQEETGGPTLRANNNMKFQNVSCVDLSRRCLHAGFQAIGLEGAFQKIDKEVLKHDVSGMELQKALSDLGWTTLYWNPDTSQNKVWDEEDRRINPLPPPPPKPTKPGEPEVKPVVWMPMWGDHAFLWSGYCDASGNLKPGKASGGVLCSDYYTLSAERSVPIDDKRTLVDFRTTVPQSFKAIPFFVGTAHAGYHVFPGFHGQVIEAHSKRALTSKTNLEKSIFNPLDQANQGGPRWSNSEIYRSGVIVVPPGYLDRARTNFNQLPMDGNCVDLKPVKKLP